MCRGLFWEHKRPLIAASTIQDDPERGGVKLMDIKARNAAIDVEWVRRYLTLEERPTWTYVLDAICQRHLLAKDRGKCDADSFVNTLLQVVDVNKQSMPRVSRRTMKTIEKHKARFDPINPSKDIKERMPIWHHIFIPLSKKPVYNSVHGRCMRDNHGIRTVGETVALTQTVLDNPNHTTRPTCACAGCTQMRERGCDNPNGCAQAAKTLLAKLPAKWDPRVDFRASRKLTAEEEAKNRVAKEENRAVIFDPEIEEERTMQECYRIFGLANNQDPAEVAGETLTDAPYRQIYIMEDQCFSSELNQTCETDVAQIGVGIRAGEDDTLNKGIRTARKTRGSGVITGMLDVVRNARPDENLELVINSPQVVRALTDKLKSLENDGWLDVPNRKIIMTLVAKLRRRPGRTAIRLAKSDEPQAAKAKEAAHDAARRSNHDPIPLWLDSNEVRGAKLKGMTQRKAYREILSANRPEVRKQTQPQLRKARLAAKRMNKKAPDDKRIWRAMMSKDHRKKVRQFKYRVMHDSIRCGNYWKHIPECGQRAICAHCSTEERQVVESASHILTECEAPGRETIWKSVKEICKKRNIPWKGARMGMILASDLAEYTDAEGKAKHGDNRLYRILMGEGMYLIWLLRNERVIQNEGERTKYPTKEAIKSRLFATLKRRRDIDFTLTNKRKFKRRALDPKLVEDTWRDVFEEEPPPATPDEAGPSF
ncbi:hypothetical protein GGG16DRAFT_60724 [Schizophyllum commune]